MDALMDMNAEVYDPRVVFDDLFELVSIERPRTQIDMPEAAHRILGLARQRRITPPPVDFRIIGNDPTAVSFELRASRREVVGAFSIFPIFDSLRRKFAAAMPAPKLVRMDTLGSYAAWRDTRRVPYIAEFEGRLRTLEKHFDEHISDGHGAQPLSFDVLGILQETLHGGSKIPVPTGAEGKIECWRDGSELLCTIRVLDPENQIRLITTGMPVSNPTEDVLGCVLGTDLDHEEVVELAPMIGCILGSEHLIAELCHVAPGLTSCPSALSGEPVVAAMTTRGNPTDAAAMALLQKCQRGETAAKREVSRMAMAGAKAYLAGMEDELIGAQRAKARRHSGRHSRRTK